MCSSENKQENVRRTIQTSEKVNVAQFNFHATVFQREIQLKYCIILHKPPLFSSKLETRLTHNFLCYATVFKGYFGVYAHATLQRKEKVCVWRLTKQMPQRISRGISPTNSW